MFIFPQYGKPALEVPNRLSESQDGVGYHAETTGRNCQILQQTAGRLLWGRCCWSR